MVEPPLRDALEAGADRHTASKNMRLLVLLRWIGIAGQLATIAVVRHVVGIDLPTGLLLVAPALLALVNIATLLLLRHGHTVAEVELYLALVLDVLALAWQLHLTGGATNPFVSLFLLQLVVGAMLLRPVWSGMLAVSVLLCFFWLLVDFRPLPIPAGGDYFRLYMEGFVVSFLLVAVLLPMFVTRISHNLHEHDLALASARQRAAEEDHIVRMGLLASGAAHELGTPLSSLAVILGDWQRMPPVAADAEFAAEFATDVADMAAAVQRCKTIVSKILLSAGEARGEAPRITSLSQFLRQCIGEWRARFGVEIVYRDELDSDPTIVSDTVLRQAFGNVIENAAEVSDPVEVTARIADAMLVIVVKDRGPGFTEEMLAEFGRPYRSTKNRPGSGLGLFLVSNMLRKFGGTIAAENRSGGGAAVTMRLPLAAISYKSYPEA